MLHRCGHNFHDHAILTTPSRFSADEYVDAYKVGSGDITWTEHIEYIARKNKPVILACGASTMDEIVRAVAAILKHNPNIALLQCNTNYTADSTNFDFINLNVFGCVQINISKYSWIIRSYTWTCNSFRRCSIWRKILRNISH